MDLSLHCPRRTRALRRIASALVFLVTAASSADATAQDGAEKASPAGDGSAQGTGEKAASGADAPAPDGSDKPAPFAFADFSWITGSPRTTTSPLDTPVWTFEFRVDVSYHYDFAHPADNTIDGSTEVFRANEVQVTQLGIGGDLHWKNVRGRLMTQFGMYSTTIPRNDASPGRGQWDLADAFRYLSEAYGGYHFDALNGINVDAGLFASYVGLFSFYQFDNWAYQPSYVSSNTPWFFNGVRVQIFTSDKLKIEPWFVNGWQSYGRFNSTPGFGLQIAWRPTGNLVFVFNQYFGADTLGIADRKRIHTDDSVQVKYLDTPKSFISKAAFTVTIDAGCEFGGGVSCTGGDSPAQYFLGGMLYHRLWFDHDLFGLTLGLGGIINPGRYLVLLPPINGATALSGTPYFSTAPGSEFKAWDTSVTFDWMPIQFVTFRVEYNHRHANTLYFAGQGGMTPPGGNTGALGSVVEGWSPDLRHTEDRVTAAILVKIEGALERPLRVQEARHRCAHGAEAAVASRTVSGGPFLQTASSGGGPSGCAGGTPDARLAAQMTPKLLRLDPLDASRRMAVSRPVGLALLFAVVFALFFWGWTRGSDARVLAGLPTAERGRLFQLTRDKAEALCAEPSLEEQCRAEVELLSQFPECAADCQTFVARHRPRGSR